MAAALSSIVVQPAIRHSATVIFIHGLGDSGLGWKPVADMFKSDPALTHVKWVLPNAPTRSVTANMGMKMPSWFDIYSFGFDSGEDEAGMLKSAQSINQLIQAEVDSGLDPARIVLGGFSQGSAISLLTGLTNEKKLAGLVALSGWLPLKERVIKTASPHASKIPIFWGHGSEDPLVKPQYATRSLEALSEYLDITITRDSSAYQEGVSYNVYPGIGHTTSQQELDDLRSWLKTAVPNTGNE